MTLREHLAIIICDASEYTFPRLLDRSSDPVSVERERCVCRRDGRTPSMKIGRCANCLSKADDSIGFLERLGVIKAS